MNIISRLSRKPFSIIGHRGAKGLEPENTLRSISRALEIGVDIVEIDVRSTKDGVLILLHDEDFSRVAGIPVKARNLAFKEIREEIRVYGESVPTLEEALEFVNGKSGLFIEIKEPETTGNIIKLLRRCGLPESVALVSFHDEALIAARRMEQSIVTGLIYSRPPGRIIDAKKIGAKIVLPRYPLATEKAVSLAHRLGLKVAVWTVNDPSIAEKMVERGVDAIATDYPDRLVELRESYK